MDTLGDRYELHDRHSAHRAVATCRGHDTRLDRPVTVTTVSDGGDPSRARELAHRHDGHPNLVPVLDAGVDGDRTFWITEPLERSLADVAPLDADDARILLHALLAGLATLHERGLALGRLSPEQVRIHDDGTVRLAVLPDRDAALMPLAGAPATPAPAGFTAAEVLAGATPTPAADALVLGALAVYARTGRPPVAAPDEATTSLPAGPEDVLALVHAATRPRLEDRTSDVHALARLLAPARRPTLAPADPPASIDVRDDPDSRRPRLRRRGRSGRVAASASIGATLALLTLTGLLGGWPADALLGDEPSPRSAPATLVDSAPTGP